VSNLASSGNADRHARAVALEGVRTVFVVPFFLDGSVHEMRVYSDVMRAQRALKRYVGYSRLLQSMRAENRGISANRAVVLAYGAIEHTRYAGTAVYEIEIDDTEPVRKQRKSGSRRSGDEG
jgi:hypothetical protein